MSAVLLIEDDLNILQLLIESIQLKCPGLQILFAQDPIAALAIFEKNKFKIKYVVCDYLLPIQNGMDLINILTDYSPVLKICIFTGDSALNKKSIKNVQEVFYKYDGIDQVLDFLKK